MPWYTFTATVDGELEAADKAEARMQIMATLGQMGSVDIEILDCEDCDEEDEDE